MYTQRMLEFISMNGSEARHIAPSIAALRIKVFWDFPYLYEGSLDYEMKYLETYFKSKHSFFFAVKDHGELVGITTAVLACEEEDSFQKPLVEAGLDPKTVCYFGESLLLKNYRGLGIGKKFFHEREKFAISFPQVNHICFCAVVRDSNHPLKPEGYKPLNEFWTQMGFHLVPGFLGRYEWKDRGEEYPTEKRMQYWIKNIR